MQRNEAIQYLKEILITDEGFSPDSITLESPATTETGYRVHIKQKIENLTVVTEIAQKHHFTIKEEKGELIIYKP